MLTFHTCALISRAAIAARHADGLSASCYWFYRADEPEKALGNMTACRQGNTMRRHVAQSDALSKKSDKMRCR